MITFKDHFSTNNAGYAAHRPTYPPALVDFLANAAPGRELALDVGCGTGQLSMLLAERFDRVIATDASAQQLASAWDEVEKSGAPEKTNIASLQALTKLREIWPRIDLNGVSDLENRQRRSTIVAILKRVHKQRRNGVRRKRRKQLSVRRVKNYARVLRKIRIVAVKNDSGHECLIEVNSQAIDFDDYLRVVRQVVKLCSSVRVSMFIRLNGEGEVKQFISEPIKEFALAAR